MFTEKGPVSNQPFYVDAQRKIFIAGFGEKLIKDGKHFRFNRYTFSSLLERGPFTVTVTMFCPFIPF